MEEKNKKEDILKARPNTSEPKPKHRLTPGKAEEVFTPDLDPGQEEEEQKQQPQPHPASQDEKSSLLPWTPLPLNPIVIFGASSKTLPNFLPSVTPSTPAAPPAQWQAPVLRPASTPGEELARHIYELMGSPVSFDLDRTGEQMETLLPIAGMEHFKKIFTWAWPKYDYEWFTKSRYPIGALVYDPLHVSVMRLIGDYEHAKRTGLIPRTRGEQRAFELEKQVALRAATEVYLGPGYWKEFEEDADDPECQHDDDDLPYDDGSFHVDED